MMRNICLFIFLLSMQGYAQKMISASVGYGTYQMNNMTKFQKEFATAFPVDAKTILAFPGYWFYEISYQQITNDVLLIGGSLGYGSTAGRISYSDYSGSINFDQLLTFYSLTGHIGRCLKFDNEKMTLTADLRPGFTYTNLILLFQERIGSQGQDESFDFNSVNIFIQPSLGIIYRLGRTGLKAQLGYQVDIVSGKLKFDEEAFLTDNDGNPVVSNWSGLRASVGVSYFIFR